jgi:uncharacterized protein (TIRG00374 family)
MRGNDIAGDMRTTGFRAATKRGAGREGARAGNDGEPLVRSSPSAADSHWRATRAVVLVAVLAAVAGVAIWRGPDLRAAAEAFERIDWAWIAASLAMHVAAVVSRAYGWRLVVNPAVPRPAPGMWDVMSAYCVGLLANSLLPARAGELVRTTLLWRRLPAGRQAWPPVLVSALVHRLLDVVPAGLLVMYVVLTARIPAWAVEVVLAGLGLGISVLAVAVLLTWRRRGTVTSSRVGRLLAVLQEGLGVLRNPLHAAGAAGVQVLSWMAELVGVWFALLALGVDAPLPAAALVLIVTNVTMAFPLWPGNVGLFQVGVALALIPFGVTYATGLAAGIVVQVTEAAVSLVLGLAFLAREGASLQALRTMSCQRPRS